MKHLAFIAAACLAAGCTTDAEPGDRADMRADRRADDEAALAAQLSGYEPAGPPVQCVNSRDLKGNRSAGETAIVFTGLGGRKWVNRPAAGCPDLGFSRALRTRTTGTRLCRGDIATVFDAVSRIEYGGCGLGDFEPYRRVRR